MGEERCSTMDTAEPAQDVEQAQFYSSLLPLLPYTYLRVSWSCLMMVEGRREACEIRHGYIRLFIQKA